MPVFRGQRSHLRSLDAELRMERPQRGQETRLSWIQNRVHWRQEHAVRGAVWTMAPLLLRGAPRPMARHLDQDLGCVLGLGRLFGHGAGRLGDATHRATMEHDSPIVGLQGHFSLVSPVVVALVPCVVVTVVEGGRDDMDGGADSR